MPKAYHLVRLHLVDHVTANTLSAIQFQTTACVLPTLGGMLGNSVIRRAAQFVCVFALLLLGGGWTASRAETAVVGRVSLAVGAIHRVAADGQRAPLKLGDALRERDRIITGTDALAMIVFSDQGRLALRPDTEVWIKSYRVDPSGAETRLDLELLRGTVRQISGRAAQLQPDRYRLNTPIAAIGVRGTDFLARINGTQVSTYVHEGAIVIQPPAADCPAIGACPIWAFSSAGDAGALLQVQAGGQVRRSHAGSEDVERIFGVRLALAARAANARIGNTEPAPAVTASGAGVSASEPAPAASSGNQAGNPAGYPTVSMAGPGASPGASSPVSQGAAGASAAFSVAPVLALQAPGVHGLTALASTSAIPSALVAAATGASAGSGGSASGGATSAGTPAPSTPVIKMPQGLAWARAATASAAGSVGMVPEFSLLVPLEQAQQGRTVTVGELGAYNLWRNTGDVAGFAGLSGRFSFGLASSSAGFTPMNGTAVAAQVDQARLDIQFDTATFITSLRLSASGAPTATLSATGQISPNGLFNSRSADGQQSVAGALTLDGREAGYFFNLNTSVGGYRGITLWGLPEGSAVPGPAAAVSVPGGNVALAPAIAPDLVTVPMPTQLVWGRFSSPAAIPLTLPVSFDQASAGRHVTVGEAGQYALWRANGSAGLFTGLKGEFSFGLAAAQAFYTPAGGAAQVATVSQASLTANFDTATFATRLQLGGGAVPVTWLEASGRINDEGVFLSRSTDGTKVVAGAFTIDAKEAAYLFRMAAQGGQFQGITLWGRRP